MYNHVIQLRVYIYIFLFIVFSIMFLSFFVFLGPYQQPMEVPNLAVKSELKPLAYTTATATRDPSHVCSLHHSARQRRIPDPLSKARDPTYNLMVTSWIHSAAPQQELPQIVF